VTRVIILDNEAVQALMDPAHANHARVLSHAQVVATRKRKAVSIWMVAPTTVRVEAGWDRTAPSAAFVNGLAIADEALDGTGANSAASIRSDLGEGISVPDAHMGAVIDRYAAQDITVITSDPDDMRAVAGTTAVTVIPI
jgi:hypothetical protein